MNYKQTLINLHKKFPEFDVDTLISILECVDSSYDFPLRTTPDKSWLDIDRFGTITCDDYWRNPKTFTT